jgi:hypothetical protein
VSRNAVVIDPTGKYHESRHSGLDPESSPGSKLRAANSGQQTACFKRRWVPAFAGMTLYCLPTGPTRSANLWFAPGVHATRGKEENEMRKTGI